MADSVNPNNKNSANFLPRFFQSDANKKFLQATVDQLVQPGTVKKVNGFIGRENAKASTGDDIFLAAANTQRQNYQLEPGLVINDTLGNNTFFKDYQDYINQLGVFGGNLDNHDRINKQEFYSWDPHINWDKFVNFQNYYWLPYGADVVTIAGQQEAVVSEYRVTVESQGDNNAYIFWPDGLVRNPTLQLYRGQTYKFTITSPGNPFSIKTVRSAGALDRYVIPGIDASAVESGTITFTVPYNSPDVLYYSSETDPDLGGVFQVLSIAENSSINVTTDLLGKKSYTLLDGTALTNGMKVRFIGNVLPAEYATGYYYVEGVGSSITLINETVLELVSSYTVAEAIKFDTTPFDSLPFSDATSYAGSRDYIVINRGSLDHNPWSRYNRWFHKDTIEASAIFNGKVPELNQAVRAVRPIIEFEANLKLFNFGSVAISDVDLVDTYTTDVFSTIEGQLGYNIDGIDLAQGQRILFTADTDILVKNKIYRVNFTSIQGVRQIHLELETTPESGNVVLVRQGTVNQGTMYWFDGSTWASAQQKTSLNQPPLFDIFNSNGISFSDINTYDGSTFNGTPIFSYKVGTGTTDSNLGFPLSYKNINNIGDIVFNFNLASDAFQYKDVSDVITQKIDVGYLRRIEPNNTVSFVNGWQTCVASTVQAALRIYKNTNKVNNFDLDIFDNADDLTDLVVKVYVNGLRLDSSKWTLVSKPVYKQIQLATDISVTDVLTIKAFAKQPINQNGHYEIPVNLQNNPLNESIGDFTLGEVLDHVGSIVDNLEAFTGDYPGIGNLRDLGNVTQYGTRFVQHSGPISLAMYHLTSDTNNVVRAIDESCNDYNKFKRNFITVAENIGIDTDTISLVDIILEKINKDKPKTFPYYFSDMVPYGASIKTEITVVDYRIKTYPLSAVFNLDSLSNKAVCVYLNGTQLLVERDYTFSDQGFIIVSATLANDDTIVIYEYENTHGSFVPATPTKLGIWPKYEPKIFLDTTLLTPRTMIQGHDGSLVLAYGDYRDDLVLELEKRIYNNIKVKYNPDIFNIHDIIPGYNRETDYSLAEFNQTLAPSFYRWTSLVDRDFTKMLSYDRNDSMTYNYSGATAPDGRETPGWWRGVYRWMLDTDRPNLCPWEMLGFSVEPTWWQSVYGPAPYTSDNLVLWEDLAEGAVKEPGVPQIILTQFKRPYLVDHCPVDSQGNIVSPLISGLANTIITSRTTGDFVFGDVSPVEAAWRRSSYYPFGVLLTAMLLQPAKTFGTLLDRSRVVRNVAGQLVFSHTNLRITPADVVLPSIYSSTTNVATAGIINYIIDYILSDNLKSYNEYSYNLENLNVQLSYRVGGFTSKEKFKLLLDSKTPLSAGSVFVPQENYNIILNSSSPVKKITYSGVIITRLSDGYEVKGYSKSQPYFKYYSWIRPGVQINVGGISESYSVWTSGSQYAAGKVVSYGNRFYRVKTLHTATTFDLQFYQVLPALPVIGGRDAFLRQGWDRTETIVVPYGTKFRDTQEVVDFLLGYGEWLKDEGFIFDEFNSQLNAVTNWETSAKEFLFWTTQNWSTGEDKWEEWIPNTAVSFGSIVRYNGDYYRAIRNAEPSMVFNADDEFVKLDGLSTVGSSVISLSPAAAKLTFSTPLCVVDDIRNPFNGYEIFKVDGTPIEPNFLNSYRENNEVSYTPQSEDGIYGASFYLVQKEQVVLIDNNTMFNDTIYNLASGYRQERIRVSGYVSTNWYGGFDVPGFIFDQAKINSWAPWTDYALGDIVKYKEFYYTAITSLSGTETFEAQSWSRLDSSPTPQLLPNWTYKAGQFEDFYSLDSDNFDVDQQKLAQHLIGYQKRQYLENIIKDDVSEFKFYQGMIVEKGTQNVLNKLFDVLSADGQESLTFYEEWALRVGQYGASASFENIEFVLDESAFKTNPQGYELVSAIDQTKVDFVARQLPSDVYLKPLGYNNNPWPIINNYTPYLRSPGYVRSNEVSVTIGVIDELLTYDVTKFANGDYIWCGFKGQSWDVYRYTSADLTVTDVTYDSVDKEITISTNAPLTLVAGDVIGINQTSLFNGFYKIQSVTLNKFVISATADGWEDPFVEQDKILIFKLTTQRASSIDSADSVLPSNIAVGELLWTDDDGTGKWATWKYSPAYTTANFLNSSPADGLNYGRHVVLNASATILIVTNNLGELIVYDKASRAAPWIQRQIIVAPFIANLEFLPPTPPSYTGDVVALSADSKWLAVGTPLATKVCSNYQGDWQSLEAYAINDIVVLDSSYYQAIAVVPTGINIPPATSPTYWKKIYYIPVETTGANSTLVNQGVISIYRKDSNNVFSLVDTILSPAPADNQKFGSNIVFGDNTVLVSAPGNSSVPGKVYRLSYVTSVVATASYNPTGSTGTTVKVSNTTGIEIGMAVTGIGFASSQTVTNVIDSTTLEVSAAPETTPDGVLSFTTTEWRYDLTNTLAPSLPSGSLFGLELSISKDGQTLLASAPTINSTGSVLVYKLTNNLYTLLQTIDGTDYRFGSSTTVSDTGEYIAISSIYADVGLNTDQGTVFVYKYDGTDYGTDPVQELGNRKPEAIQLFGSKIAFMNDYKTLVVYSRNADNRTSWALSDNTTFDNELTTFYLSKNINGGRVDIYDQYNTNWIFSESLDTDTDSISGYGQGFAANTNTVVVGAPYALDQDVTASGRVYSYTKLPNTYSWSRLHYEIDKPDVSKIKQAFLYNKDTNQLITHLDVIDSNQGRIPGIADQEIKYKTFYDPAIYTVGTNTVNVDDGMAWSTDQVGMLWWDLRTAKFYNSYDNDVVYRNSVWNTLFPGASIDIYEWVETTYLPSEWDLLADTEEGLALDISGTSLYGDDSYSVRYAYDNISKTKKSTYYFWVKNKKTVPAVLNRTMPGQDVADLISNPRGEGYKYLALTSTNSFSLVNVKPDLNAKSIVLSVEYWTVDNATRNIHTEWKLINSSSNTTLPKAIEEKWFDSLCGKDTSGRVVPDLELPIKLRYGIENRPRQGMFVNRFEALKQIIEQANRVLVNEQISEQKDLTKLGMYESEPSLITGLYDAVIDTDAELRFAGAGTFVKPSLSPVITDGKITGVTINSKGNGYLVAPYITVTGPGFDAKIRAVINTSGQIIGVDIINGGYGYNSDTILTVRNYAALVHSDSAANNVWSIYAYEPTTTTWSRVQSQSYDTRKYWKYIDWYATGYNQFTASEYVVNTLSEINSITVSVGDVVKVLTTNNGNWMLLSKYADSSSVDWTQSYKVVGVQNGTIQFLPSLYQFINTSYGYDGSLYDGGVFDNVASIELRNVLNAIKQDIFTDTLKDEYLNLFFTSIRYTLSEQNYVDWIFKTSFVKAQHNIGQLHQSITYNNDNLPDFEAYVSEVKPYRTKIREYVSNYSSLDVGQSSVTDFDLPPVYNDGKLETMSVIVKNGVIESNNNTILSYPWKHWLDNVGFSITELRITDNGTDYLTEPVVRIYSDSGSGATARAFISNGKVNRIVLLTPGSGYLSAPTIVIDGGLSPTGTAAKAIAVIGDSVVRSSLVKMKFDRITQSYFITQLEETETFVGTGSRLQFQLKWAPDARIGKSTVLINGVDALRDDYKLSIAKSTVRGYTSYSGTVTFNTAPALGTPISVTYIKDWSLLNAADRIQYYYNPASGELGKDLAQLMTGIDYGGVIVNGMGFEVSQGWDSLPFYNDRWDSFDATFDDYIVTVAANTHEFTLPYIPEAGTELNVYYSPLSDTTYIRLDDPDYGTLDQTNDNAIMLPVIADGTTSLVEIPGTFTVNTGDKFIIRKSTSDGSIKPQDADYDTALTGGDMAYSSATGLAADDILVDGDGFVTPTSSPAPEEVVPGQIVDAVAIKVYDRPTSGSANIKVDSYIANGATSVFAISQQPNSPQAIIVKASQDVMTLGVDYTLNYRTREIEFVVAPTAGTQVSIFSIGFSGSNILDLDYFVADGTTLEYVTRAPWVTDTTSIVYVDGVRLSANTPQLFRTDSTYDSANRVGIRFGAPIEAGALINFVIVSGTEQTFAITKTESIEPNGGTTYDLSNIIGDSLPIESNMIVRVNQEILKAPNNSYFDIKSNKYNYTVDPTKFVPYSVSITDVVVLAGGALLNSGTEYTVNLGGITVKLTPATASKYAGKQLVVSIRQGAGYLYVPATVGQGPQITFSQSYDTPDYIEVISSYKHDILDIQRTAVNVTSNVVLTPDTVEYYSYVGISGGYIKLDRTVINDYYVWVVKNGQLLTPSSDFKLNADRQSITLSTLPSANDEFTLITFGSNVLTTGIAYMQFKDMLNRTHFKRLSANKQTVLMEDVHQTSTTIVVEDASNFDTPNPANNKPGIIEIQGERIEYFTLNGNVLGQLRRGTLGTGTPATHFAGTKVQDIGTSSTIPYSDSSIIDSAVSDGTTIVDLTFVPGNFDTTWTYRGSLMTEAQAQSLAKSAVEVFAGGIRLKKNPYEVYSVLVHPESPEGDVSFDAEFTVDGTTKQVELTTPALAGTYITVVARVGQAWDSNTNIQTDTSKISRFLKAEPGIWYTEFKRS